MGVAEERDHGGASRLGALNPRRRAVRCEMLRRSCALLPVWLAAAALIGGCGSASRPSVTQRTGAAAGATEKAGPPPRRHARHAAPSELHTQSAPVQEAPTENAGGPTFLGVSVEDMGAEERAGGVALASVLGSEQEYGCSPPQEGALIETVLPGGPASRAGLRGERGRLGGYGVGGDVIVALDRSPVLGVESLLGELAGRHPGQVAEVEVVSCSGARRSAEVVLGGRQDDRSGMEGPEAEVERRATIAHLEAECANSGASEACARVQAFDKAHPELQRREEEQERQATKREAAASLHTCEHELARVQAGPLDAVTEGGDEYVEPNASGQELAEVRDREHAYRLQERRERLHELGNECAEWAHELNSGKR